jgi:hypothetical protein
LLDSSRVPPAPAGSRPRRRVALSLESSSRAANRFGDDLRAQILFMRLDGLSVEAIASAIGCSDDLVTACVAEWQAAVRERAERDGEPFRPRRVNRRRWRGNNFAVS